MEDHFAYFSNKVVLVTGAAGFIGSHLCAELLDHGARVIGVDNLLTGSEKNVAPLQEQFSENFTFIRSDVTEEPGTYLPEGLQTVDLILHFASPASPPRYQSYPIATYLVNSLATHNLLQFLKHANPAARFVFASTSEVYGDPDASHHPQQETYWGNVNPNGIRSCYDESKRLGETICGVHAREFEMDVRIVRIFNTYGPNMDPDDGRVIPAFVSAALTHKDYPIQGDGSQTRSYCYVTDLVRGILLMASIPNLAGETINLGNPEEHSILETAQIIQEVISGKSIESNQLSLSFSDLPKDSPLQRRPDISKAQDLLGWQPTVGFREGLESTIAYFKSLQ